MAKGLDYAFYPHPSTAAIKAAGASFVCRYVSAYAPADTNGKNLLAAEKDALLAAGVSIVIVAEETASRALGGYATGIADAQHADAVVKSLGMGGIPIYLAVDWDATEGQQVAIHAYLDGAASVIGHARTGIYGGYYPLKRAFDAGKVTYGWQTYAWSGALWDNRAQLRQVQNGVAVGGADCDIDTSMATDFGQWPRPGITPPSPPPPPPSVPVFPYPATHYLGQASRDPHCHSGYDLTDRPNVTRWQQQMANRGWPIAVDGFYGPRSAEVCRSFQTDKGLTVDGKVGPVTWRAAWTAPVT